MQAPLDKASLEQYVERVNRAIDYMEGRLRQPVFLPNVAKRAGFSYFHFHRIFQIVTGETLKSWLRKRRLSEAAKDIRAGERLIEVAIEYQFESQASFTRAFKERFFVTPGEYRSLGVGESYCFNAALVTFEQARRLENPYDLEIDIATIPTFRIIGMAHRGKNIHAENMKVLLAMRSWWASRHDGSLPDLWAFSWTIYGESAPEYVYAVGYRAEPGEEIPEGLESWNLDWAEYAHFFFAGQSRVFNLDISSWMYGIWPDISGLEIVVGAMTVESVPATYVCIERSGIDIYLPVKKRAPPARSLEAGS